MPSAKPLGRGSTRVRRREQRRPDEDGRKPLALAQNWRNAFLAKLAETSNIRQAADHAGVSPTTVYDLRRRDPGFAQRWLDALCEGYDNLEMEMTWPAGAQATLYSAIEPEALRGPQHSRDAAGDPGQRSELAGRRCGDGRVGRAGRQARLPSSGQLAVRCAPRRHAPARSFDGSGPPVFRNMENCRGTGGTNRRIDR